MEKSCGGCARLSCGPSTLMIEACRGNASASRTNEATAKRRTRRAAMGPSLGYFEGLTLARGKAGVKGGRVHAERGRGGESELQNQFRHVVLVAVGVGAVAGHHVRREAEVLERGDGVGFEVGDQHRVEMAKALFARDADELVD